MQDPLLNAVLEATASANEASGSRLDRFLGEPSPWRALATWLAPEPGAQVPHRAALLARLDQDVARIDELLATQVDAVLHHPAFQQLEATWRGLAFLTGDIDPEENADPDFHGGLRVRIRVLDASWREVTRDLERAIDFDQSQLFHKVYSEEFGTPGGMPFGLLLGDYEVRHKPGGDHPFDDVSTLRSLAQVAAASFAPFVAAAHPTVLDLSRFGELERPIDLSRTFGTGGAAEFAKWNAMRQLDDARFVGLTLPRIVLRRPYGEDVELVHGFPYVEGTGDPQTRDVLWGNACWAFGAVAVRAFMESGWLAGIRGTEQEFSSGGEVRGLPGTSFTTDARGLVPKPVCEVAVTDGQEKELSDLGFLPLVQCPGTSVAAFFGCQSVQQPKEFEDDDATTNAKLSSMLQYMLCVSRFAHYLKVMGRDKVGSFSTAKECESWLNNWLVDYTTSNEDIDSELQAKHPLREGSVKVREVPGKPGVFMCVVHLRPHFQLDQMTASIQLLTELFAGYEI